MKRNEPHQNERCYETAHFTAKAASSRIDEPIFVVWNRGSCSWRWTTQGGLDDTHSKFLGTIDAAYQSGERIVWKIPHK